MQDAYDKWWSNPDELNKLLQDTPLQERQSRDVMLAI